MKPFPGILGFFWKKSAFSKRSEIFFPNIFFFFFLEKLSFFQIWKNYFTRKKEKSTKEHSQCLFAGFFFFLEKEFFQIAWKKSFSRKKKNKKMHGKKISLVFQKTYFFQKNPCNSRNSIHSHTLSVIDRSNWMLLLAIIYQKSSLATTSFKNN